MEQDHIRLLRMDYILELSAAAPRVTADYSFKCKPGALERSVFAQRFEGIL